jgi:hypothetical protein
VICSTSRISRWRLRPSMTPHRKNHARRARSGVVGPVESHRGIYFVSVSEIVVILPTSRLDEEGRYGRSSRNVGRDAVDATMSCAHEVAGRGQTRERSREARETSGIDADGEGVWSWHPLLVSSLAEAHSAQPGCEMPSNP